MLSLGTREGEPMPSHGLACAQINDPALPFYGVLRLPDPRSYPVWSSPPPGGLPEEACYGLLLVTWLCDKPSTWTRVGV